VAKRRLRITNLLAGASTLLLIAIAALWLRSHVVEPDALVWDRGPSWAPDARRAQWAIQSVNGQVVVGRLEYSPKRDAAWRLAVFSGETRDQLRYIRPHDALNWIPPQGFFEWLGFQWRRTVSGVFGNFSVLAPADELVYLAIPYWFLALLAAIGPALKWRAVARVRRVRRMGLCVNCGYDLRGSPDRCPECGREVTA
jgi:hypothetical protein